MTTKKTVRRGGLPATDNGSYAERGSARWIQLAVNRYPEVLLKSLRRSGAVSRSTTIKWTSPLRREGFKESRDTKALDKAGITPLLKKPLNEFWPARGPRWDAIGIASDGTAIFVEAKAHIPEVNSPPTGAKNESRQQIKSALKEAQDWYPRPKSSYKKPRVDWGNPFYQYVNRLAHHYFLRKKTRSRPCWSLSIL